MSTDDRSRKKPEVDEEEMDDGKTAVFVPMPNLDHDDGSSLDDAFDARTVVGMAPLPPPKVRAAAPEPVAEPVVRRANAVRHGMPMPPVTNNPPVMQTPLPPQAPARPSMPATPPASQAKAHVPPQAPPPAPPAKVYTAPVGPPANVYTPPQAAPVAAPKSAAALPTDVPSVPAAPARARSNVYRATDPDIETTKPNFVVPPSLEERAPEKTSVAPVPPVAAYVPPVAPAPDVPAPPQRNAIPITHAPPPVIAPPPAQAPPVAHAQAMSRAYADDMTDPKIDLPPEDFEPYYPKERRVPKSWLVGAGLVCVAGFILFLNRHPSTTTEQSSTQAPVAGSHPASAKVAVEKSNDEKNVGANNDPAKPTVTPPPQEPAPALNSMLTRFSKAFGQAQTAGQGDVH